jgi:hypothetical protein
MDGELRGVKGWLLTFVIIMAVISPVWSAIRVYQEFYTGEAVYLPDVPMVSSIKSFTWAVVAADAVIGWIAAWRLVAVHNWRSVQIAIACIWLGSVGLAIVGYVGLTMITGLSFGDVLAESGPRGIIQPIGFGLIWTAYLLKSERVANTYRGGADEQAVIFE